jgi:8-amino-7-oxononanoate synthase
LLFTDGPAAAPARCIDPDMPSVRRSPSAASAISAPARALWRELADELEQLRAQHLFRTITSIDAVDGARIRVDGRWLVNFSSNDYLGLSQHPRLIEAAGEAARRWGIGARASRLLAGSTAVHAQLEAELAAWYRAEAAVVFSSGYLANLGAMRALLAPGDAVVVDRLAHASLIDACRASGARLLAFPHNDADALATVLSRSRRRRCLVVTEGVFSMDGDVAPLPDLVRGAAARGAVVYVDDAHGAFVRGRAGRGSLEAAGVPADRVIAMGTLGKALGCQGGFLAGPAVLINLIRNRARTFIYSTALPPPIAAAALEALRLLRDDPAPRQRLVGNVSRFTRAMRAAGFRPTSGTHIIPIVMGASASAAAERVRQAGYFAPAIRPPTVPRGTERLRLSVTASHTHEQLDAFVTALATIAAV